MDPRNCLECNTAICHYDSNGYESVECLHPDRPGDPCFVDDGQGIPIWCPKGKINNLEAENM